MEILLTKGRVILIDAIDYPLVSKYRWQVHRGYARIKIAGKWIKMHRLILGLPKGIGLTDHANHNKLDNRRCNISIANTTQNAINRLKKSNTSSQFKGVYWDTQHSKWRAQIRIAKKKTHLGYYPTEKLAALAYDVVALCHHGSFAILNF